MHSFGVCRYWQAAAAAAAKAKAVAVELFSNYIDIPATDTLLKIVTKNTWEIVLRRFRMRIQFVYYVIQFLPFLFVRVHIQRFFSFAYIYGCQWASKWTKEKEKETESDSLWTLYCWSEVKWCEVKSATQTHNRSTFDEISEEKCRRRQKTEIHPLISISLRTIATSFDRRKFYAFQMHKIKW